MDADPTQGLTDAELGDLARLADGTLPPGRRAEVEARVAASPQLASIVARQTTVLDALRESPGTTGAPPRLRARLERRPAPARSRWRAGGAVAVAAAALLAVILALPSGAPGVADAAALAIQAPERAAPRPVPGTPQLLREDVDGVPFPNYAAKFPWKPSGERDDDPSGRDATTVYYRNGARRIGYTIVSGDALDEPSDARTTTRGGVEYRLFRQDGRNVVTWLRDGHTCVLSGKAVRPAELLELADWRGKGAIPF